MPLDLAQAIVFIAIGTSSILLWMLFWFRLAFKLFGPSNKGTAFFLCGLFSPGIALILWAFYTVINHALGT